MNSDVIQNIWNWWSDNLLLSIPLSFIIIRITYAFVTELLDLVLNSWEINKLLKYSDILDLKKLEEDYQVTKKTQSNLDKFYFLDLSPESIFDDLFGNYGNVFEHQTKTVKEKKIRTIFNVKE